MPQSFLKPSNNSLVLLEEDKGYPLGISVDTVSISKVCGYVSDSHLPPVISWRVQNQNLKNNGECHGRRPTVQLGCPEGRKISKILFASYGTPYGGCESYGIGSCHSPNSIAVLEKVRLYGTFDFNAKISSQLTTNSYYISYYLACY